MHQAFRATSTAYDTCLALLQDTIENVGFALLSLSSSWTDDPMHKRSAFSVHLGNAALTMQWGH